MTAKSLMVQGTASSVGKSLLVTALCRIYKERGLRVAPFKSQNMSLNSFITSDGLEMGRAQVVQAEAAGIEPDARMNPVLLKPTADHTSQVIVMGKVLTTLDAKEYYAFRHQLRQAVADSYASLAADNDLIIIEGAGSPAEINLRENDIANMGMAGIADSPVLLVGDIDRGGVFAALYGTVALLPKEEQRRIRAFVVNKFRGDVSILEPGLRELESLLHRPVLGVLPYWDVRIDEEDSLTGRLDATPHRHAALETDSQLDIAVIRLPRMSNFTDFAIFDTLGGVSLRYVEKAGQLGRPDLIILPGTKNTLADLCFLHESGFAVEILRLHDRGIPLIGICGGFQMLGKQVRDPLGVESGLGVQSGLGLLDMETVFVPAKRTLQSSLELSGVHDRGILRGIGNMRLKGYEIHMGETHGPALGAHLGTLDDGRTEGAVNADGSVIGCYLHGIFDNTAFTVALLNNLPGRHGKPPLSTGTDYSDFREREYDRLAAMVERYLDMDTLADIIGGRR